MRSVRRLAWVPITLLAVSAGASGQVPAVPGAPAPPPAVPGAPALPAAATPVAAVPAAAPPRNIWGFFMMTPEQKAMHKQNAALCRAWFCQTRIGQFANNMLLPAGAFTGGLLGPVCPGPLAPNPEDLAKPPTSPQGAAARIKAEEAQVKAKIEAIEFLATVDCRYYPEAEAGLIVGLRAEKNECVRLAAAKALATGCCCTPKVLKALTITVNCSSEDKFPAERSERVRAFAFVALERCLRTCVEGEPEPAPEPPAAAKQAVYETLTPFGPLADHTTSVLMVSYFAPGGGDAPAKVYASARLALAKGLKLSHYTIEQLAGPPTVMEKVMPGFDPPRPASLVEKLDVRGLFAKPSWIKTLPKTPPAATAATPAPQPAAGPPPRTGRGNLLHIFQEARR